MLSFGHGHHTIVLLILGVKIDTYVYLYSIAIDRRP
jgi:hypothetical protein